MKIKQIVAIAVAVSAFAPAAFASLTYTSAAPGFYAGNHRLHAADVQAYVNKHGAADIRFVPPPGPVVVRAVCDGIWYQYTYYPDAKGNAQLWQNANGAAMVNKLISSCK